MADVTLTYKGNTILELNDSAEKSIKTAGKYLEDDIELDYVKSGGVAGMHFGINCPPEASLGVNGEYYYQRSIHARSIQSVNSSSIQGSNTTAYGTEFTVTQQVTVTHLFAKTTYERIGKLQIGTTAEILAETESVTFPANEWVDVPLESTIQLSTGTNYVVKVLVVDFPGGVAYVNSISDLTYDSKFSYVSTYYGTSWPGTPETGIYPLVGVVYSGSDGVYKIDKQFYKSSGTWTEIT